MKVIGIKVSANEIRYAVVELKTDGSILWLNPDNDSTENRILFPKDATERPAKVAFVRDEFDRVFRQSHPDAIVLKLTESNKGKFVSWALDLASYEAAIMIAAEQHHVPVHERRYQTLKLNSDSVEGYVLGHVSKSPKLWTQPMIDAVAVALKEAGL